MAKSQTPAPVGEVVLVSKKPTVEAPKIREISQKEYEKLRPKKELSEKQKENLAKLVERNKARALERRAVVTNAIPEVVEEDKELVIVKPKRKYERKSNNVVVQPDEPSESELESEAPTESESEVEVRKPLPKKPTRPTKPKKPVPKREPSKYKYETETTSADDSTEDESSDDERVQKYHQKAQARFKAVQEIDKRMSQIQSNTYASRNLSVF
jgi:hypothetical protein